MEFLRRVTMELNSLQISALRLLDVSEDRLEELLDYMELARDENGASASKDTTDRVSIKVYAHKEHRELLNQFCNITDQSVSSLIRKLTLQHIKATVNSYSEGEGNIV